MTIDINTLGVGQFCPCNIGWIQVVDTKNNQFGCLTLTNGSTHRILHQALFCMA